MNASWRDAETEADLAAERALPTASPAAREALYAQVMATVAAPAPTAPAPATLGAGPKLALLAALVGGAGWLALGGEQQSASPDPAAIASDSGAVSTAARASSMEPPAAPSPPPPAAPAPVEPARPVAPRRRPTPRPAPAPTSTLAAEQALLEKARRALDAEDGPAALAAVADHARRFPRGQLAEERALLEIQALVRSGRLDAAHSRAARFRARFPDSLLLEALNLALEMAPGAPSGAQGARFEEN